MQTIVYLTPRGTNRMHRSWLEGYIGGYFDKLSEMRYKRNTLTLYANRLLSFGEFLERQGVHQIAALPCYVHPFVEQLHVSAARAGNWRSTLDCFIYHLIQEEVIPAPGPPPPPCQHASLVEEYVQFLRQHRGLCREGVRYIQRSCKALLIYLTTQGVSDLHTLEPVVIHRFITDQGNRYARKTLQSTCSAIRGFLSYLYRHDVLSVDLSHLVVSPRVYKHEQCPRYLTREQIEAVLTAINRQNPKGRRDYAMVSLLVAYGLRGIEVVRLRLDDIDWRNQRLHIRRRKAGNNTTYPLAVSAGEALLAYLKDGRPASAHREVFLATMAPFAPLIYSSALARVVRKYMAIAGVQIDRPGTHTFRYSCAQRLLDERMPLKLIGDYLGHLDLSTTQRYTKIAIESLRDVAMGDGEDLL